MEERKEENNTVNSIGNRSKALPKMILLVGIMFAVGAGLVFWKTSVLDAYKGSDSTASLSKEEMETLLKDFPPTQRKQLSENPERKNALVKSLSELLAISSQAKKDGYGKDPLYEK